MDSGTLPLRLPAALTPEQAEALRKFNLRFFGQEETPPPKCSPERLAEIIAACKAADDPVIIPAGKPGPDGVVRDYPIRRSAYHEIFPPPPPEDHLPPPPPPKVPLRLRVDRLEQVVEFLAGIVVEGK